MRLDGFLVIDKPTGWTSHDVVARLRRAAPRDTKVGHAGTLDPMATGVLVVCFGAATRLAEWATADDKRYVAEMTLGVETDTYDADGAVVAARSVDVTRAQVEAALATQRGAVRQVPPAYSAIKVAGQKQYDRARRGQAVVLEARAVEVRRLDLLRFEPPRLEVDVLCSKGTYVRSLAHDVGTHLGCGAHLSALRRTASGAFTLDRALSIEAAAARLAPDLLLPLEVAVAGLPPVSVDAAAATRLRQGQSIDTAPNAADGALGRAHDPEGAMFAIVERREGAWWPRKVFVT
jgi:tRNA pseudouridine55 synthase